MIGTAAASLALLLAAQATTLTEADGLFATRRYAEAAESYLSLMEDDPENAGIRVRLGASLVNLGRPGEALPHLEAAEGMVPGDPAILQVLGQAYLAAGRLPEASARFRKLLEIAPDTPGAWTLLGACQYQLGDFETSAASFRSALESPPDDARALTGLGMSLNSLDRPAEARPFLERAMALAPADRMARLALANSLTDLGEFLRADDLLRTLAEEGPGDWEAWYFLGALRFRNSYHQQALEALDRCLAVRPHHPSARILRARSLVALGRLPEAEHALRELAADPATATDWEFLLGHAEYSFGAGDLETALGKIDAALARKPRSGMLHYWKARILYHDGEILAAQAEAEQAVALSPELPEPRGLLVRLYRVQGKDAEAAEQIEWLRTRESAVAAGDRR